MQAVYKSVPGPVWNASSCAHNALPLGKFTHRACKGSAHASARHTPCAGNALLPCMLCFVSHAESMRRPLLLGSLALCLC